MTDHTPLIDWFEKPVKQSIESVFDGINAGVESLDLFNKYKDAHFSTIQSDLSHIKILGMSTPIELQKIYYPTRISTTIFNRLYKRDWEDISTGREKTPEEFIARHKKDMFLAEEFINKHDKIVVLGGPGYGKTTLLRHLALAYSDKNVFKKSKLEKSLFPFYLSLPELAKRKNESIQNYIYDYFEEKTDKYSREFIRRVFVNGSAIALLDSLDEVPKQYREDILGKIKKLCSVYPKLKIIVSCRTADYDAVLDNFHEVEILRLQSDAVKKIISAWFSDDKEKGEKLNLLLKNDESVSSLTETPLLLSLLCIQFKHDLSLPKRRTELYRRCIDALLRDWDASRGFRRDTAYSNLSDDRKERVFENIAGNYFNETPTYIFNKKNLAKYIGEYCTKFGVESVEGENILKEIESHHGILEKNSAETYAFSHPSFQEYFAARNMISKRKEMTIVKKYFSNGNWSAVIEFMVTMLEDPVCLLEFLMTKSNMSEIKTYPAMARRTMHLWLLYRCLASGAALDAETKKDICRYIVKSQIDMSSIYTGGGVVPIGVLMKDGVRHSYYYWNKRNSLYEALKPSRKLANEIYLTPISEYAEEVLRKISDIEDSDDVLETMKTISLKLCLLIPIASAEPKKVEQMLSGLNDKVPPAYDYLNKLISESISNL